MTYLTFAEFNNSINSLKSCCSFILIGPVSRDEVEEDVEPFGRGQIQVMMPIGLVTFREVCELVDHFLDAVIVP